jgi:hypothetical protein
MKFLTCVAVLLGSVVADAQIVTPSVSTSNRCEQSRVAAKEEQMKDNEDSDAAERKAIQHAEGLCFTTDEILSQLRTHRRGGSDHSPKAS